MQGQQDCRGWLLTCDQNRQKQALKDAYNFLTQYIEQEYDDLVSQAIQKKLKQQNKELTLETQLKQCKNKQNRLLFSIQTKVKCVIFVKINQKYKQIDPVLIVYKMMEDLKQRNKQITRFCHKILPVQRAFKAQHFKMLDVVDQLFNQKTQPNEVRSWSLNFKCRNNSKFNYKQVLRQCDKIATKYGHFADIYYPQWTLSIQITNHLMSICLSQKYKQYDEYRLHKKVPKQQRPPRKQKQQEQNEQKDNKQEDGLKTQQQLRQLLQKQKNKVNSQQKKQTEQKRQQKQAQLIKKIQNGQYQVKGSGNNTKLLQQKIKVNLQEDDVDIF